MNILISDEPSVHINGEVVKVRTGESILLKCTVSGSPRPDISWWRNKEKIETGMK